MSNGKGESAASYAKECAQKSVGEKEYEELSGEMCWDAVVMCAHRSGAIDADTYNGLHKKILVDSYENFVPPGAQIAGDAEQMKAVPAGSFLAFIDTKKQTLVHAMIATGGGWAAGTKNTCVGGRDIGWENLDLAGKLDWVGRSDCFKDPGGREIQIRYRAL